VLDKTYILNETKLDATVPTASEDHALAMDKVETLDLINALFAKIDEGLAHMVARHSRRRAGSEAFREKDRPGRSGQEYFRQCNFSSGL